jgi:hypothetical protein
LFVEKQISHRDCFTVIAAPPPFCSVDRSVGDDQSGWLTLDVCVALKWSFSSLLSAGANALINVRLPHLTP